jgi:hypothetical protein
MFLPLHAAGIYDGDNIDCCADYVVCSYTPTLTALLRAQKFNQSFHRHQVRLGLIAAMRAWDTSLPTLLNVEEEISNVRNAAERASVSINDSGSCIGDAAVVTRVAEAFKSTNLVHIACHGNQNATHALSSGFCLSDESLNISRLMDLDLKDAFFAFLSACETAKGDEKQPDQTVHLAAAMLFVGFRSIVGTMWSVVSLHILRDSDITDELQGNGGHRRPSSRKAILREAFRGGRHHTRCGPIRARLCDLRTEEEWYATPAMGDIHPHGCLRYASVRRQA